MSPESGSALLIRPLADAELARAAEIDVSEAGDRLYRGDRGGLDTYREDWRREPWSTDEWAATLALWRERLRPDLMLGAFDGQGLVGLASLRWRLRQDTAQLTTLHVSRQARRGGVASRLCQEIVRLARADGAHWLYVSATPSDSAVGFYLRQGFRPTDRIDAGLYALEPEDIHMLMPLRDPSAA